MKKIVPILTILLTFFTSSCTPQNEENNDPKNIEIQPNDLITMEILDNYMGRTDVQYVDLRNMEAKFRSGYIKGFELIPFFDYLDNRAFLRDGGYDFSADQIINEELIRMYFDPEKAIFLYADGCIRSNYVKDVLYYLGYERVYVLGGYYEYNGVYNVLGDGLYQLGSSDYATILLEDGTEYHISVKYEMSRLITDIRIDIIDPQGVSYRSPNYDSINYNEQLTILEDYIISDLITVYDLYQELSDQNNRYYDQIDGYLLDNDEHIRSIFYILMTE